MSAWPHSAYSSPTSPPQWCNLSLCYAISAVHISIVVPAPILILPTMPVPALSSIAQTGFSAAHSYDLHRPSYNKAAVEHLLKNLALSGAAGANVLEIASGTGKFTTLLAARDEAFAIVAVEPHRQMSAVLQQKNLAGVEVREGSAYAIPVEDGWADAVIAAQVRAPQEGPAGPARG